MKNKTGTVTARENNDTGRVKKMEILPPGISNGCLIACSNPGPKIKAMSKGGITK